MGDGGGRGGGDCSSIHARTRAAVARPVDVEVVALHEPRGPALAARAAVVRLVVGASQVVRLRRPHACEHATHGHAGVGGAAAQPSSLPLTRVVPVEHRALAQQHLGVGQVVEHDAHQVEVARREHGAVGQARAARKARGRPGGAAEE